MKMNKKGGFDIQNYLITFLVVSGILITFGSFSYQMTKDYAPLGVISTENDTFSDTYDKLDVITSRTETIQTKLEQSSLGDASAQTQFFGDVMASIKLVIPSITIAQTMLYDMAKTIGIPVIWLSIMSTSLIILIITTFIFMILNKGQ